jgi:capsular polysaccharide biosynthesis protein
MDLLGSLRIIRERKLIVLLATLVGLIAVIVAPMRNSLDVKQYISSAKFLVTPSSAANLVAASLSGSGGNAATMTPSSVQAWFADENTLRDLLTSEELMDRVISTLKLKENWATLKTQIKVEGVNAGPHSNLYRLSATAADPDLSRKLCSTLCDEFTRYVQDLSAREYSSYRRFLEELAGEAEGKLKHAESMVVSLKKDDSPEGSLSQQTQAVVTLRDQLSLEKAKLKSQVNSLAAFSKSGSTQAPPWLIVEQKSPALNGLEGELAQARLKLMELSQLYTPTTDLVIEQKQKVAKIEEVYNQELASYVKSLLVEKTAALQQTELSVSSARNQYKQLMSHELSLDEKLSRAKAERQLTMWQENYLSLTRQLYQARVLEQASRRQGAIAILERPQMGVEVLGSKGPVNPLVRLVLGLPFCFLFGIGAALAADYLFASMKIQPRIEQALNLPVIALIPPRSKEFSERWDKMKAGEPLPEVKTIDAA